MGGLLVLCFCCVVLQSIVILAGLREDERAGLWSWSRFLFLLAFAALESTIIFLPAFMIHDTHNRYFWPVYAASWVVAALNFIWMIRVVRRWVAPGDRTDS
jgi:hypothetical protein